MDVLHQTIIEIDHYEIEKIIGEWAQALGHGKNVCINIFGVDEYSEKLSAKITIKKEQSHDH